MENCFVQVHVNANVRRIKCSIVTPIKNGYFIFTNESYNDAGLELPVDPFGDFKQWVLSFNDSYLSWRISGYRPLKTLPPRAGNITCWACGWTLTSFPTCRLVLCPEINRKNGNVLVRKQFIFDCTKFEETTSYAHISDKRREYLTTVSFSCNRGFTLVGHSVATCMANRIWNVPPPRCSVIVFKVYYYLLLKRPAWLPCMVLTNETIWKFFGSPNKHERLEDLIEFNTTDELYTFVNYTSPTTVDDLCGVAGTPGHHYSFLNFLAGGTINVESLSKAYLFAKAFGIRICVFEALLENGDICYGGMGTPLMCQDPETNRCVLCDVGSFGFEDSKDGYAVYTT
ncbi:uncharacterized protein [Oscarella lobularis]|uniref:uncharacterized protein n=1 Tax=Oscarella lobularis TaxID=121494 RepID=UPI0033141C7A